MGWTAPSSTARLMLRTRVDVDGALDVEEGFDHLELRLKRLRRVDHRRRLLALERVRDHVVELAGEREEARRLLVGVGRRRLHLIGEGGQHGVALLHLEGGDLAEGHLVEVDVLRLEVGLHQLLRIDQLDELLHLGRQRARRARRRRRRRRRRAPRLARRLRRVLSALPREELHLVAAVRLARRRGELELRLRALFELQTELLLRRLEVAAVLVDEVAVDARVLARAEAPPRFEHVVLWRLLAPPQQLHLVAGAPWDAGSNCIL